MFVRSLISTKKNYQYRKSYPYFPQSLACLIKLLPYYFENSTTTRSLTHLLNNHALKHKFFSMHTVIVGIKERKFSKKYFLVTIIRPDLLLEWNLIKNLKFGNCFFKVFITIIYIFLNVGFSCLKSQNPIYERF